MLNRVVTTEWSNGNLSTVSIFKLDLNLCATSHLLNNTKENRLLITKNTNIILNLIRIWQFHLAISQGKCRANVGFVNKKSARYHLKNSRLLL